MVFVCFESFFLFYYEVGFGCMLGWDGDRLYVVCGVYVDRLGVEVLGLWGFVLGFEVVVFSG